MTSDAFNLAAGLELRRQQHLYRQPKIIASPQGARVQCDGQELLSFCSNDYLGMANNPQVIEAFKRGLDAYGVGSGASHLVCGHSRVHQELEESLAEITGRERALLFSTGYMANMGTITALIGKTDSVYEDKLNHASLLEGGLASRASFKRYHHNDVARLEVLLQKEKKLKQATNPKNPKAKDPHRQLIVTDTVFSMDGDIAPLCDLSSMADKYNAWLMVDDAHGFGCLGEGGSGTLNELALSQQDVPVYMATLGKAIGTSGAFVAGSSALIETLIQFARTYIYTTAMPPALAAATLESLKIVQRDEWRREKLDQLIQRFRLGAAQLSLPIMDSNTAIQPLVVGDADKALAISEHLWRKGFWVTAIRPPTVAKGSARLRITLNSLHEEQDVDALLDAVAAGFSLVA
ncbi:MAG: 8-amino-7-oxononanoate synthase [Pseudomonadales bacterium]|nr:8-amino-7-oxononanoate synthase [Pseudomonadales bacterium]